MSDVLEVMVDGIWRQGERSLAVRLMAEDGAPLPDWQPGAHIDVHLPCGIIRQYSLTGSCTAADSYLICVARESATRGGSRYIHETLRPGQRLLISPPRNLFPLQEADRLLLLAAGIGITPLYAMALHLEAAGRAFELHYYVKSREDAAFIRELTQPLNHGVCIIHRSDAGESPRLILPDAITAPEGISRLYACGPAGFMAAVRDTALAAGWPETQIHTEAFQPVVTPVAHEETETFTVTLASSGESWPVPANKSIAQVLMDNGVAVPLSCEMGICGACLTPVIDGVVDHRDTVQSDAEKTAARQQIALCCSRSKSGNVVIDL
ncbi:PDR/VanB family oxidoreductase [Pseudescherichia vulneris]|uniref:PDR/VanB family oxidoreductase n=1 Tax=Pseudescherichia vulneris TaxID=566 RepID=UPI00227D334A|nr:PDR/VanB family oxidoreductase [Pseudescherichia vulneris]WAH53371.1 PDR/VanB family oxidoreductase [Pseudescherichia vulneris]